MTEFQDNPHTNSRRKKKSLVDQIASKKSQIAKHQKKIAASQKRIEALETELGQLEMKQQQNLLKEYGLSMESLKDFLETNKDQLKKGDDAQCFDIPVLLMAKNKNFLTGTPCFWDWKVKKTVAFK